MENNENFIDKMDIIRRSSTFVGMMFCIYFIFIIKTTTFKTILLTCLCIIYILSVIVWLTEIAKNQPRGFNRISKTYNNLRKVWKDKHIKAFFVCLCLISLVVKVTLPFIIFFS